MIKAWYYELNTSKKIPKSQIAQAQILATYQGLKAFYSYRNFNKSHLYMLLYTNAIYNQMPSLRYFLRYLYTLVYTNNNQNGESLNYKSLTKESFYGTICLD